MVRCDRIASRLQGEPMKKRVAVWAISGSTASSCENRDRQADSVRRAVYSESRAQFKYIVQLTFLGEGFRGSPDITEPCGGNGPGNTC